MHPEVEHLKDLDRAVGIICGPEGSAGVEPPAEPLRDKPVQTYEHLLTAPEAPTELCLPQDFRDELLSIGVRLHGEPCLVRADRTILTAQQYGAKDYGLPATRFSKDGPRRFLNGEAVQGAELLVRLEHFVQRFVVLPEGSVLLVATGIVGTYLYQVFDYYPYLVLRSPEKRCGKSTTLNLLA